LHSKWTQNNDDNKTARKKYINLEGLLIISERKAVLTDNQSFYM